MTVRVAGAGAPTTMGVRKGRVRRALLATAMTAGAFVVPQIASAHTDALGFIITPDPANPGKYIVNIYYGTYSHGGTVSAEGSAQLSSVNGSTTTPVATSAFQLVPGYTSVTNGVKPDGLTIGGNYFFVNSSTGALGTTPYSSGTNQFQYATFSNLAAGSYSFGYVGGGTGTTQQWQPLSPAINAGTFSITDSGNLGSVGGVTVTPTIDTALPLYTTAQLGAGNVLPTFSGGVLQASATGTVAATLKVGAQGGTVDTNGNTLTFGAAIVGDTGTPGTLTVKGGGTLVVTQASTYAGDVYVNGGVLRLTNLQGAGTGTIHMVDPQVDLPTAGTNANNYSLDVASPASSDPTVFNNSSGGTVVLSGQIATGTGAGVDPTQYVTFSGNGTTQLTNTANSWTGTTTINSGTTLQGASNTISGTSIVDNGTLAYNQAASGTVRQGITGSGGITVAGLASGNTLTFAGTINTSGALTVTDGSNVTVSGSLTSSSDGAARLGSGTFTNTGAITATGNANAVLTQNGLNATLVNAGTIEGAASAVINNNSGYTGSLTVQNTGSIKGDAYDGVTQHGPGALTVTNQNTGALNSGVIYGQDSSGNTSVGYGVGSDGGGALTLTNGAGAIIVGYTGVRGSNSADTISNAGTIAAGSYDAATGTVTTGGGYGVNLTAGGTVINGASGNTAAQNAASVIEGGIAIQSGAALTLTNYGKVTGTSASLAGVNATGATSTITNYGTVSGGAQAVVLNSGGTVYNYGTGSALGATGTSNLTDASGVYSNGALTLTNQGTISTAHSGTAYGVEVIGAGTITNTGSITAAQGAAGVSLSGGGTITNGSAASVTATPDLSTISGNGGGIVTAGTTTLTNYGQVLSTAAGQAVVFSAGGTITNGSATNAAATIKAGNGSGINNTGAAATTVANYGLIQGYYSGAGQASGSGAFTLHNYTTGVVYGSGNLGAFNLGTGALTVTNDAGGKIVGAVAGVYAASGTALVSNAGTIGTGTINGSGAFTVGGAGFGVEIATGAVTNTGTINSTGAGVYQTSTSGTLTLVNTGTIGGAGHAIDPDDAVVANGAATILNSGTIATPSFMGINLQLGGTVTNAAGGTISGGTAGNRYGVYANGAATTVNNYGTITSTDPAHFGIEADNHATTINLYAGSSTGTILTGTAADSLTLYSGAGTANQGVTTTYADAVSGAAGTMRLQNAGTLAAATVGAINLGTGATNTLTLRGTGDGTVANGVAGSLNQATVANPTFVTFNKADSGTWTVSGNRGTGTAWNLQGGTLVMTGATTLAAADVAASGGTELDVSSGGSLVTTGASAVTAAAGGFTLKNSGTIVGTTTPVTIAGTATVTNSGLIGAGTYNGTTFTADAGTTSIGLSLSGGTVTNNAGATISGAEEGISGNATLTLDNSGTINATARGASGGSLSDYDAAVYLANGGTVTNRAGAVLNGYNGIDVAGTTALSLTNAGLIQGNGSFANGLIAERGTAGATIVNIGTMQVLGRTLGGGAWGLGLENNGNSILNAGTIAGDEAIIFSGTGGTQTVVNAAAGVLDGLTASVHSTTDSPTGTASTTAVTFTNYGKATAPVLLQGSGAMTVALQAGSTTGAVTTGAGNDTLTLYTGHGTGTTTAVTDAATGLTLQNAGTLAAATVGAIDLGGGANTLNLRGTGDGSGVNGAGGTVSQGTLADAATTTLNKLDSGTWTITGDRSTGGAWNLQGGTLVMTGSTILAGTVIAPSAGTTLTVNNGGLLRSTGATTIGNVAGAFTVNNAGTIDGTSGNTIQTPSAALALTNTGTVTSSTAVAVSAGAGSQITNSLAGAIVGGTFGVVNAGASAIAVSNAGLVGAGTLSGTTVTPSGTYGINLAGGGGSVTNTGTIRSGAAGVYTTGALALTNTGLIYATGTGGPNGSWEDGVSNAGTNPNTTVLNSGTIKSDTFSGVALLAGGTVTNAAGGTLTGGTDVTNGDGVNLTGTATVNNYGTINGSGGAAHQGIYEHGNGSAVATINLYAGSTTGTITTGAANDALTLYTGHGTADTTAVTTTYTDAVTGASSTLTLQNAGTLAAATVGAVDLGGGTNTLTLAGAGDGSGAYGAGGTLAVNTLANATTLTKQDSGVWTLTGTAAASDFTGTTTISGGTLAGGATSFGTGAIVDNATLSLLGAGTFGNNVSGSGVVTASGATTSALTLSGALSNAGGLSITDASTVTIAATGSATTAAITITGAAGATVNNLGTVATTGGFPGAIYYSAGGTVNNGGAGNTTATINGGGYAGIYATGGALTVGNDGVIYTAGYGVVAQGGNTTSPTSVTLTNTGRIVGGAAGVVANDTTTSDSITNSGLIQAGTYNAANGTIAASVTGSGLAVRGTTIVTNNAGGAITGGTGSSSSDNAGIASLGALTLSNAGAISGGYAGVQTASGSIANKAGGQIVGGATGVAVTQATTITNAGLIGSGTLSGTTFTANGTGNAISLATGGTITNGSTTFTTAQNAASVIDGGAGAGTAINVTGGTLALDNSGLVNGVIGSAAGVGVSIVNRAGATIQNTRSVGDLMYPNGTVSVLNAGTMKAAGFSATGVEGTGSAVITNAAGGVLEGGNDPSYGKFGNAIQFGSSTGTLLFNNYGSATSDGNFNAVYGTNSGAATVNLFAGSTTGKIGLGSGNDALTLYTGHGTGTTAAMTDATTGIVLQAAGTLAAAAVGTVDLGGGANTLTLRGAGDGSTANGVGGSFSLTGSANLGTLTKQDSGTWTLTGAGNAGLTQITAGTNTASGLLVFNDTGLTSAIYVNGAIVRAIGTAGFGTGTIYAVDPTVQFASTTTYGNAIVLQTADATNDPTRLQVGNGITATLTGAISQGTAGANNINNQAIAATQPLIFELVPGATAGTFVLTNGTNNYNGLTTINAGTTVQEHNTGSALGTGGTLINGGAVLQLDNQTGGVLYTEGGTISGTGTLRFTGNAGSATALGYGGNGNTVVSLGSGGLIDVVSGKVNGSSSGQGFWTGNKGDLAIASGAIFDGVEGTIIVDALTGAGTLRGGYGSSGSTTIGIDNGSGTFTGTITDSTNANSPLVLIKQGTGTETLTGTNTYTGATTISGGKLALQAAGSIANTAVIDNATLDISGLTNGGTTIQNLTGTGTVALGANKLTLASASTFNGTLTDGGIAGGTGGQVELSNGGTYTLAGANSYTGQTTIDAATTLQVTAAAALAPQSAILDNGTLFFNGATGTVGNAVSGTGGITVTGAGTTGLALTGALTDAGGVTITDGSAVTLTSDTGGTFNGVSVNSGTGASVTVVTGGQVTGKNAGIYTLDGTNTTIVNRGTILSAGGASGPVSNDAITAHGTVSVDNFGTIKSNAANAGIVLFASGNVVTNEVGGTITGGVAAPYGYGVNIENGSTLNNYGTINTSGPVAAVASSAADLITNTGTITGSTDTGRGYGIIYQTFSGTSASGTTTNQAGGTIQGGRGGVLMTAGSQTINNAGVIRGTNAGGTVDGIDVTGGSVSLANQAGGLIVGATFGVNSTVQPTAFTNDGTIAAGTYNPTTKVLTIGTSGSAVSLASGTVTNDAGGRIIGGSTNTNGNDYGVFTTGALTLTNAAASTVGGVTTAAGKIVGGYAGVEADGLAAITNNGLIASGTFNPANTGTGLTDGFTAGGQDGIRLLGGGTVTNNAGALISGGTAASGIYLQSANSSVPAITITNAGTITAANGVFDNNSQGKVLTVANQAGGLITATNGYAVYNGVGDLALTNAGTVQQTGMGGNIAVYANGNLTLFNSGTISDAATGTPGAVDAQGNLLAGSTNSGLISAAGTSAAAFYVSGMSSLTNQAGGTIVGNGQGLYSGGAATLTNAGTIASGTYNAAATPTVALGTGQAVYLAAGGTVGNTGALLGGTTSGYGLYAAGALTLTNSGDIAGYRGVVSTSIATANTLTNTGRIVTGTIAGNAQGGAYTIAATGNDAVQFAGGTITNGSATNATALIYGQSDGVFGNGTGQVNVDNFATIRADGYAGVELTQAGTVHNEAGATILGGNRNNSATDTGAGVRVESGSGTNTVLNDAGALIAATGAATNIGVYSTGAAALTLVNAGTIVGRGFGVETAGSASINNAGLIGAGTLANGTGGAFTADGNTAVAIAGGTVENTSAATIGGALTSSAGLTLNNAGLMGSVTVTGNAASTVSLRSGSTTGAISLSGGNDSVTIYTGSGAAFGGVANPLGGPSLVTAGTHAAATVTSLALGAGTNTVTLAGTGTEAAGGTGTGQAGTLALDTVTGMTVLTKTSSGNWTLTGATGSPAATIFAGNTNTIGATGTLTFNTTGLTGDVFVNGATIVEGQSGAFGTGTVHAVDPTIVLASGTNANNYLLEVGVSAASNPTVFQIANGGAVTLTGSITTGTGVNGSGNNIDGQVIDTAQPVTFALATGAPAGSTATFTLANATGTANSWTGATTINSGVTLVGTTATISGGSIVDNGILNYNQATDGTVAQQISGGGGVVKDGTGTVTFAQQNGYSGGTVINAGTLQLLNSTLPGGTAVVAQGARLEYDLTTPNGADGYGRYFQDGETVTGGGVVAVTGNQNLSWRSTIALDATGQIRVEGGSLNASSDNLGHWENNQGGLYVASGATFRTAEAQVAIGALTGAGTVVDDAGGSLTLGVADASGTFDGAITSAPGSTSALIKTGAGTQTLTGTSTYAGPTIVNGGTLALTGTGSIANSSVAVAQDATFDVSGETAPTSIVSLTGAGTTALGASTLTLTNASGVYTGTITDSATNAGTFEIGGGTFSYGTDNIIADNAIVTVDGGATLNLAGYSDTIGTLNLYGTLENGGALTAGTYNAFAGSTIGQGIGTGALNIYGDTLLTSQTNAAPVSIYAGTLTLGAAERLGDLSAVRIAAGGALTLGGDETIGSLSDLSYMGSTGGGTVNLSGATLTVGGDGTSTTFSGTIADGSAPGGSLTKVGGGTLTLAGANTYTGATMVDGGTLALAGGQAIADTGAVTVTAPGTLQLLADETIASLAGTGTVALGQNTLTLGTGDASSTFSGTIGGTGNVTLNGAGTLTLTGANTYTGTTEINGGTFVFGNANVLADASTLSVNNGDVELGANSDTIATLNLTNSAINGTGTLTAGLYDLSDATVNANLGTGTLGQIGGVSTIASGVTVGATAINVSYGTLQLGAANQLTGNAALAIGSNGILDLNGFDETVDTAVIRGTLDSPAGGRGGTPAGTLTARTYTLDGGTFPSINDPVVNANLGTGTLIVQGKGVSTLNGTAGATTVHVTDGTLQLGMDDRLADAAAVTVDTAGTLDLGGYNDTVGSLTLNGRLDGGPGTLTAATYTLDGALVNANLGTGVLTQVGDVSVLNGTSAAGTVTVAGGTLQLGANDRLADTAALTVASQATLNLLGNSDTVGTAVLDGTLAGTGTLTAATYQLNGATIQANLGTGTLTQASGTSVLNGTSAAGIVNVTGGTLQLGADDRLADTAALTLSSGATLDMQGFADTVGSAVLNGTLAGTGTLTAATYQLNGATVNANLGTGALTQASGSSLLNGTSAASTVTVAGGTLTLGGNERLADTAALTVATGADLNLGGYNETIGTAVLNGTLDGTGTLQATATATTADGANYVLNGATVNANLGTGTLLAEGGASTLNGTAAATTVTVASGTLALGASDRLADTAALTVATGAALNLGAFSDTVATAAIGGALNGTGTLTAGSYTLTGATVNANLGAGTLTQAGGTSVLNGTAAAGTVNINAGALQLGASDRLADTAAVAVATGATLDVQGFNDTVGSLALAGSLAGTGTLTAGTYTLNNAVVNAKLGAGALVQAGGTSVLNGTAGAGTVAVDAGTLQLGANDRLADTAAVTVAPGTTLDMQGHTDTVGSLALNGTLAGTGTLTAGTYTLNAATVNANLGTGALTQAGGASMLNGSSAAGTVAIDAGTLTTGGAERLADTGAVTIASGAQLVLGGAETIGSLAGAGTVALGGNTLTAGGNGASTTFAGVASGTGGLTKAGAGTLTLTGANTYTGATTINAGTLAVAGGNAIADGSAVTVASGATLALNNNETVGSLAGAGSVALGANTLTTGGLNASPTFAGAITGTGGLTKVGTGTLTLSGTNTYTGATAITAGTLAVSGGAAIADTSAVTIASGATLALNGSETIGSLAGAGSVALGASTLTAGGTGASTAFDGVASGTGGLTKVGSGTLTLTGANTYTGATTVGAGTLVASGGNAIADGSAVTVGSGATLALANAETIGSLAGAGSVALGANTLTAGGNGASTSFSGVASGTGGLTKVGTGTLTLAGANAYTGATAINAGTLALGATNALAAATPVTVAAGATLDLGQFTDTVASLALNGTLAGTGTLTAATYQLNGAAVNGNLGAGTLTQAGGTSVLTGTSGAGTVNVAAGTLRLGASNRLADAAATTVAAGAVLDLGQFSDTVGSAAINGMLAGTGTLSAGTYTLNAATVNANLGTGTLRQAGGTSVLAGTSNAGTVNVTAGTLRLGASDRLADTAATTVAAGAVLDLGQFSDTVASAAINGTLAGTGTLSAGTYTLNAAAVNANLGTGALTQAGGTSVLAGTSGGGTVNVAAGTLRLGASDRLADTAATTVAAGAVLDLGQFSDTVGSAAINGTLAGTGTLSAVSYQLNGAAVNANLGAGTLTQAGGTSVLAGTSGAATINVNAGVLQLAASERLADGAAVTVGSGAALNLAGNTETVGAVNGAGTVALGAGRLVLAGNGNSSLGGLIGTGTLDKNGTGTLTLANAYAATGTINVNAGTAALTGATAGSLRVAGGALTGTGTVVGTLGMTGGTVAPGTAANPFGTLTAGSLSFTGGAYAVDFGGAASGYASDLLRVAGTATLAGTVAVAPNAISGNNVFQRNYTIVQAGSLSGTFANGQSFAAVANDPTLFYRLRYDAVPNAVVLQVQRQIDFGAALNGGGTPNQNAVAAGLNGAAGLASDSYSATLNAIATAGNRAGTLDSLSGEAIADVNTTALFANEKFADLLRARLGLASGGAAARGAYALRAGMGGDLTHANGLAGSLAQEADAGGNAAGENGAGAWLQGYGAQQRLTGGYGEATSVAFAGGLAAGLDGKIGNLTLGAGGGFTRLDTQVDARASTLGGRLSQGGAYAGYDNGRVYLALSGDYYGGHVDTTRLLTIGTTRIGEARGRPDIHGYNVTGLAGVRFDLGGGTGVALEGSAGETQATRSGFSETAPAGLGLVVGRDTRNLFTGEAKLRVSHTAQMNGTAVTPYASAGARFYSGDLQAIDAMQIAGAPTGTGGFLVDGAKLSPVVATLEGGLELRHDRFRVGIDAGTQLSDRVREGEVKATVRIGF